MPAVVVTTGVPVASASAASVVPTVQARRPKGSCYRRVFSCRRGMHNGCIGHERLSSVTQDVTQHGCRSAPWSVNLLISLVSPVGVEPTAPRLKVSAGFRANRRASMHRSNNYLTRRTFLRQPLTTVDKLRQKEPFRERTQSGHEGSLIMAEKITDKSVRDLARPHPAIESPTMRK